MSRPRLSRITRSGLALGFLAGLFGLSFVACEGPLPDEGADVEIASRAITVPAKGTATTLDIGSWNVEWFGDSGNGPTDDNLQRSNVHDVISGANLDIWGLAEVVSTTQFNTMKSQLPGYAGFLSNDATVVNGSAFYTASEQKVGVLYKTALASVQDARLILTGSDNDFAGRPPLQVTFQVTLNGTTESLVLIVMHAKCCDDTTSWQRRQSAATALKSYLDSTFPTQKVLVVGDFNDDLDTSITSGEPSPYAALVSDTARYSFPTKALTDAHIATTTDFPDAIDHHLNTNEEAIGYVAGSVEAYRVDQWIPNYATTTSDHYPVLSRYNFGGAGGSGGTGGSGGGTAQVIINEILANEPGSDTSGEFVEMVNVGTGAANLAGWTLSDSSAVRHTFATGTTLAAGKAIVVFGGAGAVPGGLTNAVAASTGTLSLANGGDSVHLKDAGGVEKNGFTYSSSLAGTDGVSMNRSPDGSASGSFVLHTSLATAGASPGKRVDGSAW